MADAKTITVMEVEHANEMHENLKRRLQELRHKDVRMDSVRSSILGMVVQENYDAAMNEIKGFVEAKSDYPSFQARVERHVQHACDLIEAINTKRNFPGMTALSLSKQQELHEKVLQHFEELKGVLKHVEGVEREQKVMDLRSTVWVLQAICAAGAMIFCTILFNDIRSGLLSGVFSASMDMLDGASTWIVRHIPFLG